MNQIKFMIVCFMFSVPVQAQTGDNAVSHFCENYFKSKIKATPEKNPSSLKVLGFIFRYQFAKPSFLEVDSLNEPSTSSAPVKIESWRSLKVYSVGSVRSTEEREAFAERKILFLEKVKSFKKNLGPLKDEFSCQNALDAKREELASLENDFQALSAGVLIEQDIQNKKIEDYLRRKLIRFEAPVRVDSLMRDLSQANESVIVLVLHAASDGTLYDSDFNQIPRSVFAHLHSSIRRVVIYSCYPEAVKERYALSRLAKERQVEFQVPQLDSRFSWVYGDSIPIGLLFSFLKKPQVLADVSESTVTEPPASVPCSFRLLNPPATLGVWLNQTYIGMVSVQASRLDFNCSLLTSGNVISLQEMNLYSKGLVGSEMKAFSGEMNGHLIQLIHHFDDEDHYIGSKAEF